MDGMSADGRRMAVLGLGYVGLPLATVFAEAGFRVLGLDIDPSKVDRINRGLSVTLDVKDETVSSLISEGLLEASCEFERVGEAELVSICVPTPLSKSKDPDISYIVKALEDIVPHVSRGTVLVLESTTYPGTTRDIILPRFRERGFEVGKDLFLAFSPERVDPGNPEWGIKNTPKVLGGVTEECGNRAAELYGLALDRIVKVSCAEAAEMVKLLENTFRAINIGLVNELAMVCNRLNLDVWEIIDAAATKPFGFMPFKPGPGLGGHCIPIDPLYLSWKMRTLDYRVRFIDLADEVNSAMPQYVVERATAILNDQAKPVRGSRILILGMAYKPDIDDVRESPALDLWDRLDELGARLFYHDPFVRNFRHGKRVVEGLSFEETMDRDFDLALIVTDHRGVDYEALASRGFPILDTRNVFGNRGLPHVHGL